MKRVKRNNDILDYINAVNSETGVSKEAIFTAIENAFVDGAKRKYGHIADIVAKCNRNTGETKLFRVMQVVDKAEDKSRQLELDRARKISAKAEIGDFIEEEIPSHDFDRVNVQRMGAIINNAIRDSQKETEYEAYVDRIGELVTGVVKRVLARDCLVMIGKTEAVLATRDSLPNERFNIGDRISACIQNVVRDNNNPQIILSRASEEFISALMSANIEECENGSITCVAIAREPGFRTKVAVSSSDSRLDPVGACIGPRGSRIKAVVDALKGERIDIIEYSNDPEILIQRAITPAKAKQVIIDERKKIADVIVDSENFSLAIGRRGQNVRLISKISGYKIDVMLESERQERSTKRFNDLVIKITEALNLDEIVGQVLVASGFDSIESIAESNINELASIEGFDEEVAQAVQERATEYVQSVNSVYQSKVAELGIQTEVLELPILTKEMVIKLGESNVKTIQDIADLASDELAELLNNEITEDEAGDIVMIARRYIYGI